MNHFYSMCAIYNITDPFPVVEHTLCQFAAFLANKGIAAQSIRTYLSALRNAQISMGYPDPRDRSSLAILKRVQAGIRRAQASSASNDKRIRLPITTSMLRSVRAKLEATQEAEKELVWAVATLAFFGFFRLGELLLDRDAAYTPTAHLSWGDIAADSRDDPSMLRVHLKRSKCDQFGMGVDVFVGRTRCELCPVAAVLSYLAVRGSSQGPIFIDSRQQPLTKAKFVARIRNILAEAGYPSHQFAGHSFRIGAATAAAQAGIEDSTIQALGRWHSSAFLTYIRTPRDRLAGISTLLAARTN